jgi:dTDP-4-amino-4,6-dideoxygalactose transaminase
VQVAFNQWAVVGEEEVYVTEAIRSGHLSGDGKFTRSASRLLEQELGAQRVLLTTSCTHALEMCAFLLDIEPGDEVIVPSFTFVSSANAFVVRGARPVFIDIRSDTQNLDETQLERLITSKTKAIVVVHYGGIGAEMDTILSTADKYRIPVIEDNAHGLFAKYRGKSLGTIGALGTQSFHHTKNFSSGEGGALIINKPALAERAEILREKGTNRSKFFRGQVDKYTWVDIGSSYLPSELNAAYLFAQLEARGQIQARRRQIWERYNSAFQWLTTLDVSLPCVPSYCDQAYHVYYLLLPSQALRAQFIEHMKEHGVITPFHYVPLHTSPMGLKFGAKPGDCPVTETVSDTLVRLPLFFNLTDEQQSYVIEQANEFFKHVDLAHAH